MGRGYDAPFPHRFSGRHGAEAVQLTLTPHAAQLVRCDSCADASLARVRRALYQLSLVKSSEARRFVPPELRLVELGGYTLGGLYLARYDDSPAGAFDELVALAGLVWNPPGSCAWAARVYVSNAAAQRHGVKEVGLPSYTATFQEQPAASGAPAPKKRGAGLFWWRGGDSRRSGAAATQQPARAGSGVVRISAGGAHVCTVTLPAVPASPPPAPRIALTLPSFSGATPAQPALLRYALALRARVRPCAAADVSTPTGAAAHATHALAAVLGGRRLLTLAFDAMEMDVGQPQHVRA